MSNHYNNSDDVTKEMFEDQSNADQVFKIQYNDDDVVAEDLTAHATSQPEHFGQEVPASELPTESYDQQQEALPADATGTAVDAAAAAAPPKPSIIVDGILSLEFNRPDTAKQFPISFDTYPRELNVDAQHFFVTSFNGVVAQPPLIIESTEYVDQATGDMSIAYAQSPKQFKSTMTSIVTKNKSFKLKFHPKASAENILKQIQKDQERKLAEKARLEATARAPQTQAPFVPRVAAAAMPPLPLPQTITTRVNFDEYVVTRPTDSAPWNISVENQGIDKKGVIMRKLDQRTMVATQLIAVNHVDLTKCKKPYEQMLSLLKSETKIKLRFATAVKFIK